MDGGGTKTAFAVSGSDCVPVATALRAGCSYQTVGLAQAADIVCEGILAALAEAKCKPEDCAGCCIGIPCWGENAQKDEALQTLLAQKLGALPFHLTNDVEVGWAGASACTAGIHIVSGTGAIGFGRDAQGGSARSGGWHEFFGDEGSCYWIGRETMSLFTKQADGRLPKGPLYEILRAAFGLTSDFEFVERMVQEIVPLRAQVAGLQGYALQAARAGDTAVKALYVRAAHELALLVQGVRAQLAFAPGECVTVTYSGGLFHAESLILAPLAQAIEPLHCRLSPPQHSATVGALMLANHYFNGKRSRETCI